MLPSWLFGKSKSKLIEELGGGGGTSYTAGDGIDISSGVISFDPSTMDAIPQSKVTDLDDDLADLAPKTALSNPNILHNPWFQVNQRSITRVDTSNEFVVDRWKSSITASSSGTFTVNSNGTITIANTSESSISLYQKRTDTTFSRLKGRKVTLSVMLSDGTIYSGTGVVPDSGQINLFQNEDIIIILNETDNKIFSLYVCGGKTITIKALKLEIGEISTLAMDTAPDMSTELAKCQRYFLRINNEQTAPAYLGLAMAKESTLLTIQLPYNGGMRIKTPSISSSQDAIIYTQSDSASGTNATDISGSYSSSNGRAMNLRGSGFTTGAIYAIYLASNGYIDINAEL